MGAAIAEIWLEKFIIPPPLPLLEFGTSKEGRLHNTGEAAERPPMAMVIQISADIRLCANAAPPIPKPQKVPAISTVLRTELASKPRLMSSSTKKPPTRRPQHVATSHGAPVNRNDRRRVMCCVCAR